MRRFAQPSRCLLLSCFLLSSGIAEIKVIIPRVDKKNQRKSTYRVDSADDHFNKAKEEQAKKIVHFTGSIRSLKDQFGHYKVRKTRAGDRYVVISGTCLILRDRPIKLSDLRKDDQLMLLGTARGYLGPDERVPVRRRIFGATFIFRLPGTVHFQPAGEKKKRRARPGSLTGYLTSVEPKVLTAKNGDVYEVRPFSYCRVIAMEEISEQDLKKGMLVIVTGRRQKFLLRPKGKTLTRYAYVAEGIRVLSPDIPASTYRKLFSYRWAE